MPSGFMTRLVVSTAALACLCISSVSAQAIQNASLWPYQTFKSRPEFQPPVLNITKAGQPAPGYLFFAPLGQAHQAAPLIMTDDNELIYHGQNYNGAFNFGVQTYKNQQVIVYWNGTRFPEPAGRGYGNIFILDKTYKQIANVSLSGNFVSTQGPRYPSGIDLHELYITRRNTVLVTANNATQSDLTSVGGAKDGWIIDGQVYEIDIATGEILFSWSALDHVKEIPLTASVYTLGSEGFDGSNQTRAWGYFHINSVAPFNDGYIISSRYLCSAIVIDKEGNVLWRLSGRDGADFTLGPNTNFCFQHDIRPVYSSPHSYKVPTDLVLHLHDNANSPIVNKTTPTSGLRLNVNQKTKHVTLNRRFQNPANPLYAPAQGSYQALDSTGHVLLGHGYIPYIEEFAANGSIVETIQFGANVTISYRAFRQAWVGCPSERPAVFVDTKVNNAENMTLYMSWNGATEFDEWVVSGGSTHGNLTLVERVKKDGFETSVCVPRTDRVVVEARSSREECRCDYSDGRNRSPIIDVY